MPDNSMFRYLMKYVGKYRVLTELTTDTNDFIRDANGDIHSEYDELYIPCNKDAKIKHSYKENILAYITDKSSWGKSIISKFKANNIPFTPEDAGDECVLYFNADDIDRVAKLVGAKSTGKKIKPFDKVNIPDRIIIEKVDSKDPVIISSSYKIPPEDMKLYYTVIAPIIGRSEKIQLSKKTLIDFDEIIKSTKNINPDDERNKFNIGQREYIHSIGMWNEYIKYVKNAVEEFFKK